MIGSFISTAAPCCPRPSTRTRSTRDESEPERCPVRSSSSPAHTTRKPGPFDFVLDDGDSDPAGPAVDVADVIVTSPPGLGRRPLLKSFWPTAARRPRQTKKTAAPMKQTASTESAAIAPTIPASICGGAVGGGGGGNSGDGGGSIGGGEHVASATPPPRPQHSNGAVH